MSFRLLVEYRTTLDHAFSCPEGPRGAEEFWMEPVPPEPDAGWVLVAHHEIDAKTVWRRVRLVEASDVDA